MTRADVCLNHLAVIQLHVIYSFDLRTSLNRKTECKREIESGGSLHISNRLSRVNTHTGISIANSLIDA
jgi:hypothetical protein